MNNVSANLRIYFEEPNWICEYFRKTGGEIEVCKLFFLREIKKALLSENYFFASRLS